VARVPEPGSQRGKLLAYPKGQIRGNKSVKRKLNPGRRSPIKWPESPNSNGPKRKKEGQNKRIRPA